MITNHVSLLGSALAFVGVAFTALTQSSLSSLIPQPKEVGLNVQALPMQIGEWSGKDAVGLSEGELRTLKLQQYIRRNYSTGTGLPVALYVGFWKHQTGDNQAAKHSPLMCLPANGWQVQTTDKREIQLEDGGSVEVRRVVAREANVTTVAYYWFFYGDAHQTDEWRSLIYSSLRSFVTGRADGGIAEASVMIENADEVAGALPAADARLAAFLKDFFPAFRKAAQDAGYFETPAGSV